jgi:uncharacterized membrane protein YfcA
MSINTLWVIILQSIVMTLIYLLLWGLKAPRAVVLFVFFVLGAMTGYGLSWAAGNESNLALTTITVIVGAFLGLQVSWIIVNRMPDL